MIDFSLFSVVIKSFFAVKSSEMDDELSALSSCDELDAASSSEDDGIDVESDAGGDQPDTPRIDYKVSRFVLKLFESFFS